MRQESLSASVDKIKAYALVSVALFLECSRIILIYLCVQLSASPWRKVVL